MPELDLISVLKSSGALAGSGGVVVAVLYGLAHLVRAWREPSTTVAQTEAAALGKQLQELQGELQGVRQQLDDVLKQLEHVRNQKHDLRYQRDKARVLAEAYALKLGETPPDWPHDVEEES